MCNARKSKLRKCLLWNDGKEQWGLAESFEEAEAALSRAIGKEVGKIWEEFWHLDAQYDIVYYWPTCSITSGPPPEIIENWLSIDYSTLPHIQVVSFRGVENGILNDNNEDFSLGYTK